MDRFLEELPELESRLLLYAAGELSVEEAEAVERELADPATREALEQVRGLLAETVSGLAALDRSAGVSPRTVRRASDRAVRAVFGWNEAEVEARTLRLSERHPLAEGVVWRYARWPLAAAAVLVVGLMLWTFGTDPTQGGSPVAENPQPEVADPVQSSPEVAVNPGLPIPQATGGPLEQVVALFDNPAPLEVASGLSDELAALRLLSEPDWE